MDSSVSLKDQVWFLRVCRHISNVLYYHTELHENLKNALHADTKLQTDGCDLHTSLSFSLRNERLKQFGYHCLIVLHNECAG